MVIRRSIITLFSDPKDLHSHRARIILAEKNIEVDIISADPNDPPEEVIEFNPYRRLPLLMDRELVLYESRIISEYLDERYPHPPLLPVEPVSRATFRMYLYRVEQDWYQPAEIILSGRKGMAKARKMLKESLIDSAPIFFKYPYFLNEEYSMVDASIAPLLWRLPLMGIDIDGEAGQILDQYMDRLFKREAFKKSLSEQEKEMRE